MEKVFEAIVDVSKDYGIGLTIPVAIWVVVKAVAEDLRDKLSDNESASEKNHSEIVMLQLQVARLEEKLNSMERAVY